MPMGQLSKKIQRKIVIIFQSISLNMCLGAQDETVLLSTHNICLVEK